MYRFSFIVVTAAAVVVAGCAAPEHAGSSNSVSTAATFDSVAGLPISDYPTGPRAGVPHADIPVEYAIGNAADILATDAVADLEEFWKVEYPRVFRSEFVPVAQYVSLDSAAPESSAPTWCGTNTAGFYNAKYCFEEAPSDSIGWDRTGLLPDLVTAFGPIAAVTVLAHEYGHAIQFRASLVSADTIGASILVSEQQADCFAGSFLRYVAEGKSAHFTLNTTDGLDGAMLAMLALRDGVYGPQYGEHGSGFERLSAMKIGVTDGPAACAAISEREIAERRGDLPQILSGPDDTGELPITTETVEATLQSAQRALGTDLVVSTDYDSIECPDSSASGAATYCAATNTIHVDLPQLQRRGAAPEAGTIGGDADAFALVVSRYALALAAHDDRRIDDAAAGLRAACLTGAWAAGSVDDPEFRLSPGDLDEIVAGLLADGLVAADANDAAAPSGFVRVDAFQTGVYRGASACDAQFT